MPPEPGRLRAPFGGATFGGRTLPLPLVAPARGCAGLLDLLGRVLSAFPPFIEPLLVRESCRSYGSRAEIIRQLIRLPTQFHRFTESGATPHRTTLAVNPHGCQSVRCQWYSFALTITRSHTTSFPSSVTRVSPRIAPRIREGD